jgi:curved DNA-binding protein CbpA
MVDTDYYKTLQVDPAADPEVIEAAYRRLARKFHPDTNPAPDANARMAALNEAYAVIGDPQQRADYDLRRRIGVRAARPPAAAPRPSEPVHPDPDERIAARVAELRRRQQQAATRARQTVSTPQATRPIDEPQGARDVIGKILAVVFIVLFLALLAAIGASLGVN